MCLLCSASGCALWCVSLKLFCTLRSSISTTISYCVWMASLSFHRAEQLLYWLSFFSLFCNAKNAWLSMCVCVSQLVPPWNASVLFGWHRPAEHGRLGAKSQEASWKSFVITRGSLGGQLWSALSKHMAVLWLAVVAPSVPNGFLRILMGIDYLKSQECFSRIMQREWQIRTCMYGIGIYMIWLYSTGT